MSVYDWTGAIKITFDKPITSNPDLIIGFELASKIVLDGSPSASSNYSGYYPSEAFDGVLTDGNSWYTNSALPQWLKYSFSSAKTIGGLRIYQTTGTYRIKDAIVQASSDDTNWVDIATVQFTNTSGWQSAIFSESTYRYWRLYITSGWNSYAQIFEMEFYSTRARYNTGGWTVAGFEYDMVPGGQLVPVTYNVRRITKSEDNLSLTVWLSLNGRMSAPVGDVTVSYSKTLGNLQGAYGSVVDDFSLSFTPQNIVPLLTKPGAPEYVQADLSVSSETKQIIYTPVYSDNENISANLSVVSIEYSLDELEE